MPDKLSFGKTFYALEKAISISQRRNELITSNISNLDTPKYKPTTESNSEYDIIYEDEEE